jgi:5-oxoprolinase (ATP-hydrolysing) subunit A
MVTRGGPRQSLLSPLAADYTSFVTEMSVTLSPPAVRTVDLNADLGEYSTPGEGSADKELLSIVTSANIACGAHAGNDAVMREVVAMAAASGVAIGAHPGYGDPNGFGRRELGIPASRIRDEVARQIRAMLEACAAEGATLSHVKPHGALYNRAVTDAQAADAIAEAVRDVDPRLTLVGLAGSELVRAGRDASLTVAREAFADRAYLAEGTLAPRDITGAVLNDENKVADRAVRMVIEEAVTSMGGATVRINADTICVHGDSDRAVALARAVRQRLEANGIRIARYGM